MQKKPQRPDFFIPLILTALSLLSLPAYTQPTGRILNTIPAGADVLNDKDIKLGTTPFDFTKLPSATEIIKIVKEDYDTTFISFLPNQKKGVFFPSSVSGCNPPCSMDFTAAADKDEHPGTLRLRKKIKEYDRMIMVAIDTPVISISPETEIGKVNNSKKNLDDKEIHRLIGYVENIDIQILNAFNVTYLDAYYHKTKKEDKTTLYRPKIILKPVINKMSFDLDGKLLRDYTGPCSMECTWNISTIDNPKTIIAGIPVKTSFYRTSDNYELLMHQMLYESERDLLEQDTLYDFLLGLEKAYLKKSKGEVFEIKNAAKTAYASSKEMLRSVTSSVVTIENATGFGSGVIISKDGYIITNYHVVQDENIKMKIGGIAVKVNLVKTNKDYDLALLKANGTTFKPLIFGNNDLSQAGDEVFAIGTPLEKSLGQTITKGIISGYREINGVQFIQTDVSINAGNSGGPLINEQGEIIGIATMKLFGKGVEGIGFCIPSNVVLEMLNIRFKP